MLIDTNTHTVRCSYVLLVCTCLFVGVMGEDGGKVFIYRFSNFMLIEMLVWSILLFIYI